MNMEEMRRAIHELTPQEARFLLLNMLLKVAMVENNQYPKEKIYEDLLEIRKRISEPHPKGRRIGEPTSDAKQVHLVFGDSFAGSLKISLKKLEWENDHKVISFPDRYSIGPLWKLHTPEGQVKRREWFRDNINGECEDDELEQGYVRLFRQLPLIPREATVTIWSSGNANEQVGLRYAVHLLRDRQNELAVFDPAAACYRLFNSPGRSIEYLHSGEIPIDKLVLIMREGTKAERLNDAARIALEHEWQELAGRHETLRIWRDGRIVSVSEDYFDSYLIETIESFTGAMAIGIT